MGGVGWEVVKIHVVRDGGVDELQVNEGVEVEGVAGNAVGVGALGGVGAGCGRQEGSGRGCWAVGAVWVWGGMGRARGRLGV